MLIIGGFLIPFIPPKKLAETPSSKYSHMYYPNSGVAYFKAEGFRDQTYYYKFKCSHDEFLEMIGNQMKVDDLTSSEIRLPTNYYFRKRENQSYFKNEKRFPECFIYDHKSGFGYVRLESQH